MKASEFCGLGQGWQAITPGEEDEGKGVLLEHSIHSSRHHLLIIRSNIGSRFLRYFDIRLRWPPSLLCKCVPLTLVSGSTDDSTGRCAHPNISCLVLKTFKYRHLHWRGRLLTLKSFCSRSRRLPFEITDRQSKRYARRMMLLSLWPRKLRNALHRLAQICHICRIFCHRGGLRTER